MNLLKLILSLTLFVSLIGLAINFSIPPKELPISGLNAVPTSFNGHLSEQSTYNLTEAEKESLASVSSRSSTSSPNKTVNSFRHNL